jgi:hypothetical protein
MGRRLLVSLGGAYVLGVIYALYAFNFGLVDALFRAIGTAIVFGIPAFLIWTLAARSGSPDTVPWSPNNRSETVPETSTTETIADPPAPAEPMATTGGVRSRDGADPGGPSRILLAGAILAGACLGFVGGAILASSQSPPSPQLPAAPPPQLQMVVPNECRSAIKAAEQAFDAMTYLGEDSQQAINYMFAFRSAVRACELHY